MTKINAILATESPQIYFKPRTAESRQIDGTLSQGMGGLERSPSASRRPQWSTGLLARL